MFKLALFLFIVLNLTSGFSSALSAETEKCSIAEERIDYIDKSKLPWVDLYAFFKEVPSKCDDGGVAEGLTDIIAKNLAAWRDFPRLIELSKKDPKYFNFIKKHIDETALQEDLKQIFKNSRSKCPKNFSEQCKELETAAILATTNSEPETSSDAKIGILEYSKVQDQFSKKPRELRAVRAVFYKKDGKWTTGDQAIKKTDWQVTFDGKTIGKVTTENDKTATFASQVGLQEILSPIDKIPSMGKLTEEFATWSDSQVYRPLVVTTGKYKNDPEKWKPAKLSKYLEAAVRKQFKKNFPDVKNCKDPSSPYKDWKYTDRDLKIVKSFANSNELKIVGLELRPYNCDGPPEVAYSRAWYLIYRNGETKYLESGMILVDAGDYDNDGKSELIFQVSRYNQGGYIMYTDSLTNHTDFLFSYH